MLEWRGVAQGTGGGGRACGGWGFGGGGLRSVQTAAR